MNIDWQPHRIERLPRPANDARFAIADNGTCFGLFRRHDSAKVWSLWSSDQGYCADLSLPEDFKFPIFAPLQNRGVLVANGLCPWIDGETPGLNAHLFDANGKVLESFHAGSSISDIQGDSAGRIWISYFDEGVFGNHGWNGPGPAGLGSGGLVCVDIAGHIHWQHNHPEAERYIDDCYALNVTGLDIWFYYYSDFCLGQIRPEFMTSYSEVPFRGSHAFATDGKIFVFAAQYREEPTLCHLAVLGPEGMKCRANIRLVLPKDVDLNPRITLIKARGEWLHLFQAGIWAAYHLSDLPNV
ncbi:hypothetical protein AB4Z52_32535 [Rhizobium sp. 2YAF20]|uniref:hypothetical protein n=1 Tax=Rhizobium sp. 2YAF20 TaxID=3233027 RepID=UPI003F9E6410